MSTPSITDGQHAAGGTADLSSGGPINSEPVILAHLVTIVLGAVVTAGWLTIPNSMINTIGDVVCFLLATGGALAARARVSPSGKVTWTAIVDEIQSIIYDEIDRIVALPQPATPATPAAAPAPVSAVSQGIPVGTFTTSSPFGPTSPDAVAVTAIQPVVPTVPEPAPAPTPGT